MSVTYTNFELYVNGINLRISEFILWGPEDSASMEAKEWLLGETTSSQPASVNLSVAQYIDAETLSLTPTTPLSTQWQAWIDELAYQLSKCTDPQIQAWLAKSYSPTQHQPSEAPSVPETVIDWTKEHLPTVNSGTLAAFTSSRTDGSYRAAA